MEGRPAIGRRLRTSFDGSSATAYAVATALSIGLLVFVVPGATLLTGIAVPGLLVAAAAAYFLAVYRMGIAFEGVSAAMIAVAAFNITAFGSVPVAGGQEIRVVDALLVATLCGLLGRYRDERVSRRLDGGHLVIGAFGIFVLWTALAGVVGSGPSSAEAFRYAGTQLRYGLLLVAAALLVERTDVRSVVHPLVLALGGALVFAVDEVFAGTRGYPSHFGVLGTELQRLWPTPSLTSFPVDATVIYVGSPVGQSRIMVGMAVFFVPLVVATVLQSRAPTALAAAASLGVVSVLASSSDSGILALYAVLAIVALYWCYRLLDRYELDRVRRLFVPLSGVVGAVAVVWFVTATAAGREEILLIQTNNLNVRLRQYRTAIDVAARYPLFGIGGGENFARLTNDRWGVHNLLLANLVATGVPGCLAYLVSAATATWLGIKRLVRCPVDERWIWVGILAAMAGFYTYSFWTIAFQREPLNAIYWLLVGAVVGSSWGTAGRDG